MGLEIKLGKIMGWQDSPAGQVETESMAVWRVDVYGEELPNGFLHVGTIGRHDGANFCENHEYGKFTIEQREDMLAQIRALHGNPSTEPPVELPEDISLQEEEEEEEDEDEVNEDEEDVDLEDTDIE